MTTAEQLGTLIESNDIMTDTQALQARARQDGYLFIRGLFDRNKMMELRRQFVGILQELGWLRDGTDPMDAISDHPPCTESEECYAPLFERFQKLEDFHTLPHSQSIIDVLDRLFGEKTFAHPRNIGRVMLPSTPITPPHQDYFPIRGSKDTWTAWAPMGDCPLTLGGLAVLPGMHEKGMLPTTAMPGAGGSGIESQHLADNWLTTSFECGDVLLLHCMTPHKSLPNQTGERCRLSVDYRYQGISQPIDGGSLEPHMRRFDWPFVYEGWKSTAYQYYWKNLDLDVQDFWSKELSGKSY